MSNSLSNAAREAVRAEETSELFLQLLTIDHPDLVAPIRVVNDKIDIVSGGETFIGFPFELTLPNDEDGRAPRARLSIDNVDRQIVQVLREISSAPTVVIKIVRASAPDVAEVTFPALDMMSASYDIFTVQAELSLTSFENEPFPADKFTPKDYPGLFT